MADDSISPMTKRRSIQHLMDGRRNSIASVQSNSSSNISYSDMGYGEQSQSPVRHSDDDNSIASIEPSCDETTKRDEKSRPPCSHYERRCTIVAPCCGAAFGCRICHDECPVLPPKMDEMRNRRFVRSASMPTNFDLLGAAQTPEDTEHQIDRFAIKEVICRNCFTKQSSKTYVGVCIL